MFFYVFYDRSKTFLAVYLGINNPRFSVSVNYVVWRYVMLGVAVTLMAGGISCTACEIMAIAFVLSFSKQYVSVRYEGRRHLHHEVVNHEKIYTGDVRRLVDGLSWSLYKPFMHRANGGQSDAGVGFTYSDRRCFMFWTWRANPCLLFDVIK